MSSIANSFNPDNHVQLSGREVQVLRLASSGLLDKQIALELKISLNTLNTYWFRIRRKTGRISRGALIALFVKSEFASEIHPKPEAVPAITMLSIADPATTTEFFHSRALRNIRAALLRADRAVTLLGTYPKLFLEATSEAELNLFLCRVLVEMGGYAMVWLGLPEQDLPPTVRVVESFGDVGGYLKEIQFSLGSENLIPCPTVGAVRTGRTCVYRDFLTDLEVTPWRDAALLHGFQSAVALPLQSQAEIFGVVTIYYHDGDAFDRNEMNLLEGVAHDFGIRIKEIREQDRPV
jgi:DNA-binding CsgD family transcriptional regulator